MNKWKAISINDYKAVVFHSFFSLSKGLPYAKVGNLELEEGELFAVLLSSRGGSAVREVVESLVGGNTDVVGVADVPAL